MSEAPELSFEGQLIASRQKAMLRGLYIVFSGGGEIYTRLNQGKDSRIVAVLPIANCSDQSLLINCDHSGRAYIRLEVRDKDELGLDGYIRFDSRGDKGQKSVQERGRVFNQLLGEYFEMTRLVHEGKRIVMEDGEARVSTLNDGEGVCIGGVKRARSADYATTGDSGFIDETNPTDVNLRFTESGVEVEAYTFPVKEEPFDVARAEAMRATLFGGK